MIAEVVDKVVVPEILALYLVVTSMISIGAACFRSWLVLFVVCFLIYAYGVMNFYVIDDDIIEAVESEMGSLNYRNWNLIYLVIPIGLGFAAKAAIPLLFSSKILSEK